MNVNGRIYWGLLRLSDKKIPSLTIKNCNICPEDEIMSHNQVLFLDLHQLSYLQVFFDR